jgi:cupin domain
MRVSGIPNFESLVVSVVREDTRLVCRWQIIQPAGLIVADHHHHRDEVVQVQSGRIRLVLDGQEIELAAGQRLLIPAGVTHSHVVLEAARLDYYGEAKAGLFMWEAQPDGTLRETELYVSRILWTQSEAVDAHRAQANRQRLYRLADEPPNSHP